MAIGRSAPARPSGLYGVTRRGSRAWGIVLACAGAAVVCYLLLRTMVVLVALPTTQQSPMIEEVTRISPKVAEVSTGLTDTCTDRLQRLADKRQFRNCKGMITVYRRLPACRRAHDGVRRIERVTYEVGVGCRRGVY